MAGVALHTKTTCGFFPKVGACMSYDLTNNATDSFLKSGAVGLQLFESFLELLEVSYYDRAAISHNNKPPHHCDGLQNLLNIYLTL